MKKKGWIWLLFLILLMALLAVLATRYNVISIRNQNKLVEPVLGTIGFAITMGGLLLFFVRLAQEMKLNQLQSEFLAAVTHELKTPIATLELSSSLLKDGSALSPEERTKLWSSHQEELKRLRQEVEMLLEAARWDARAIRVSYEKINLQRWIDEYLPRWRQLLGENGELKTEGEKLDFLVSADPRILNLIVENLIDNARKFAKDRPSLTVRSTRADGRWRLDFIDQGWGFDADDAKRIFKRFYRSRAIAPYSVPGSGLGLYLAKSAAARMRMDLMGTSEGPGQGARFSLEGKVHG